MALVSGRLTTSVRPSKTANTAPCVKDILILRALIVLQHRACSGPFPSHPGGQSKARACSVVPWSGLPLLLFVEPGERTRVGVPPHVLSPRVPERGHQSRKWSAFGGLTQPANPTAVDHPDRECVGFFYKTGVQQREPKVIVTDPGLRRTASR
jgi:hypothetical protein